MYKIIKNNINQYEAYDTYFIYTDILYNITIL